MTAVLREFEYLVARARREGNEKLEQQLTAAYVKYLEENTR